MLLMAYTTYSTPPACPSPLVYPASVSWGVWAHMGGKPRPATVAHPSRQRSAGSRAECASAESLVAVARTPLSPVKLLGEGDHNIRGAATASLGAMAAAAPIVVEWGR
jgi:hypothetical protein